MTHPSSSRRIYPLRQHILCFIPLIVVVLVILATRGSEQGVEDYFTELRHSSPALTWAVKRFSKYGNIPYYVAYGLILITGIVKRNRGAVRFVAAYLLSLVVILVLVDIFKFTVGRPRPYHDDEFDLFTTDGDNHSFPSGHVTETLFTPVPLAQRYGRVFMPLVFGLSPTLMAVGRLYLGKHHPSDFLGSLALSSLGIVLAWWLRGVFVRLERAYRKGKRRDREPAVT